MTTNASDGSSGRTSSPFERALFWEGYDAASASKGADYDVESSSSSRRFVGLGQLLSSEAMLEANAVRRSVIRSALGEQTHQSASRFRDPLQIAVVSASLSMDAFKGARR